MIEGRQSFRTFGNSRSLSVGIRSYATGATLEAPAVDLAFSSLGIDFLEFSAGGGSWSTGSIALAVGAGYRVVTSERGAVSLSVFSQGGVLQFAEPGAQAPRPLGIGGAEVRVSPGPIGMLVAVQGVVAGGPAGTLTASQLRVGVTMRL